MPSSRTLTQTSDEQFSINLLISASSVCSKYKHNESNSVCSKYTCSNRLSELSTRNLIKNVGDEMIKKIESMFCNFSSLY